MDTRVLARRAARLVADLHELLHINYTEGAACDPQRFSYWLVINVEMSMQQRYALLMTDATSLRLRSLISLLLKLKQSTRLSCLACESQITQLADVITLPNQSLAGNFVNPHGFMHQIMLTKAVTDVALIGQPSSESTWFDGYAWTIMNCAECNEHLGWRFTEDGHGGVAEVIGLAEFFGLRRSAISAASSEQGDV
jgi:cereblon